MTAHTPAHFTPAQVLDAGLRAETEGRYDFALQVYRHLVVQYPMTPEAYSAQEGMARLAPPDPGQAGVPATSAYPGATAAPMTLSLLSEPQARHVDQWPHHQHVPGRRPISIAPVGRAGEHHPFVPPRLVRDYAAGRVLAKLIAWTGWLSTIVGLGLVPVTMLAPEILSLVPGIGRLAVGPASGGWLVGSGLGLVVLGQLARALLEQANATRDLAALSRARAEHEAAPHAHERHGRH